MKHLTGIIILILLSGFAAAQEDTAQILIGTVENGDTIFEVQLNEIWVYPGLSSMSNRQKRKFWKYVYKIKKVYPYAQRANELLKKYEPEYDTLKTRREKRRLMNKIEDELLAEYKDELKKLTISEGRILIKLIDRETGRTSYSLIKDFRGSFSAFFWQAIAKIFKNDLKSEYNPEGEDRIIEEVVRMIEEGKL